jgi:hypothetical protein
MNWTLELHAAKMRQRNATNIICRLKARAYWDDNENKPLRVKLYKQKRMLLFQPLPHEKPNDVFAKLVEMGWGSTSYWQIPRDWRTRRGPERVHTPEHRAAITEGLKRRWAEKRAAA